MVVAIGSSERQPPPSGRPPTENLASRDIAGLLDELREYLAIFGPLFLRSEQRQWALKYVQGQLLDIERKSVEPMALALDGGNVQAMQQFISIGAWDDEAVLHRHQQLVAETLGDPATGVLIIDGCDFPKQGKESVGVARQWCGPLGKTANCQASVVAAYASRHGYTLVDRQLYLHQQWFTDAYRPRWERCGIPDETPLQTQPELAWTLIERLQQRGDLPFAWVTFDEHFGNNPVLLDRVAGAGLDYLAEAPHSTRVWWQSPRTAVPPQGRGRAPTRRRVCPGEPEPLRVDEVARRLPPWFWRRHVIYEGAKGRMVAEFAFVRMVAVRDALPGPEVWVVFRRSLGQEPELKVYLSNAPRGTRQRTLVRLSGMRWPVESAIEECKGEVGMDHYEVRGWVGWHHHITMSFLAHHFLVRLRRRLGGKISGTHRPPSTAVAAGGVAETASGRPDSDRPHSLYPTAELCGVSLPSEPPLA